MTNPKEIEDFLTPKLKYILDDSDFQKFLNNPIWETCMKHITSKVQAKDLLDTFCSGISEKVNPADFWLLCNINYFFPKTYKKLKNIEHPFDVYGGIISVTSFTDNKLLERFTPWGAMTDAEWVERIEEERLHKSIRLKENRKPYFHHFLK